jgi:phosphoribosylanthranilate isomerase
MARVKICGLSTPETMQAALDFGADLVGLVFYPKSPRNVSLEQAIILAAMARSKAQIVALVVDPDDALLQAIATELQPDFIQAHGSETPDRVRHIVKKTNISVIKAIKVKDASDIAEAQSFRGIATMNLYDAKAPETLRDALPGGNGIVFDWSLLKNEQGLFMLSGGLNPENVAHAVRITHAPIVDVSSGVESSPGVKDAQLIAKFIKAAKSV